MYSKRIKEQRKAKGLTQAELAKLSGVGQATISAYESGVNIPSSENLRSISRVLEVSTDWLIGKTNEQLEDVVLSDDETQLIEAWRRGDSATIMRLFADKLAKSTTAH